MSFKINVNQNTKLLNKGGGFKIAKEIKFSSKKKKVDSYSKGRSLESEVNCFPFFLYGVL